MNQNGSLEVHDNVMFQANTAEDNGGAVSLPIDIGFVLAVLVFCDGLCEA